MLSLLIFCSMADAQLKSYPGAKNTEYEYIEVNLSKDDNRKSFASVAIAAIPFIVETTSTIIDTIRAKKIKKYAAQWNGSSSGDDLYLGFGLFNPPKIEVLRKVKIKKETGEKVAAKLLLIPVPSSDGKAFKYKLESVYYKHSKAKLKRKQENLDLSMDITFLYLTNNQENNGSLVGKQSLKVNGIKLHGEGFSLPAW